MNIAYAGNYKVFKGMLLSVLSVLKHYRGPLNVYILTANLTMLDREYQAVSDEHIKLLEAQMQSVNANSRLIKLDVSDLFLDELSKSPNNDTRYTAYTLLRLLLDKIEGIPAKLLYLDTDTMISGDIKAFYDTNIDNYELAGVKDRYGRFFLGPRYLNAGVLLLNIERIKQSGLFVRARALLNKKKVFLSDQSAINKYVQKKLMMPRRFNEQKRVKKSTVIRHFSMQFRLFPKFHFVNIKPWNIKELHNVYKCHAFDDIFEKYLKLQKEYKLI